MNIYEVAKKSVNEGSFQKIRPTREKPYEYDLQPDHWQGNNRGWALIDTFTSSAIVQIYENIQPENQIKYVNMPLNKVLDITWSIAGK